MLVLYTDGVTEVRRHRREVFGTEQLVELLKECGGLRPDAVAERVERAVMHASMGKLRDDMAVLVLGPDPSTTARDCHACRPGRGPGTHKGERWLIFRM